MTKVIARFDLREPLADALFTRLSDVHKIYGINSIEIDPEMKSIAVDYDASRLSARDVEAALRRAGLPLARP